MSHDDLNDDDEFEVLIDSKLIIGRNNIDAITLITLFGFPEVNTE